VKRHSVAEGGRDHAKTPAVRAPAAMAPMLPRAGHSGVHHVIDHDLPVDRVERQFAAAGRPLVGRPISRPALPQPEHRSSKV
jgi:hypothetical protein